MVFDTHRVHLIRRVSCRHASHKACASQGMHLIGVLLTQASLG